MSNLLQNYQEVSSLIADACRSAGRDVSSVQLLAVSKMQSAEAVRVLLNAGHRAFGENRVQEAKKKFDELRSEFPDLRLHLIGLLQTNKVDEAVRLFDVIETLDRPRLADALDCAAQKMGKRQECYIEVNIGDEPQKAGVSLADLDEFIRICAGKAHLLVSGLMCIPPQGGDPTPHFRKMQQLATQYRLPNLSMGMSGDFAEAIRCGSTEVRVGTALFGERLP